MPGPVQTLEYESSPGRWRYSSATPNGALAGIVQEYWEVEGRLSPFREKILPNGYTELMVNLGPPHTMVTHTGTSVWDRAWFSGLHERAIVIESLEGTHLVSARLHPLGALRVFGPEAARSVNGVVDLEALLGPPARELRELLLGTGSTEERFAHLDRFLVARLSLGTLPSTAVRDAAREGDVMVGTVEYRPDSIVFPTQYQTDKGTTELRATWTRTGPDSYRVAQSQRAGEAWKPLWAMELKRKPSR